MTDRQIQDILAHSDHTLLAVDAKLKDVQQIADEGMKYGTASICIPASFVADIKTYIDDRQADIAEADRLKICTVIGFPNGYDTTAAKCFMAQDAVKNGAAEVDMVINIGWVKDGKYDDILDEINQVKAHCDGRLLKVIVEICKLTDEEIIKMCDVVSKSDAEYIKTSTGFAGGGATFEAVKLMSEHVYDDTLIKAAGGISSLEDAEEFMRLGASRLGTSKIVGAVKRLESVNNI
ncbi:MAG: deoxyribose-phosphate aldolase [Lachnospiraceae bacterium]|nr:deoxyribose-phosphate aldolase [Lachnospiraceae bacterium]